MSTTKQPTETKAKPKRVATTNSPAKKKVAKKPAPEASATRKKTPARSNGLHPGGRPSKYSEDILKAARDYLVNYEKHDDKIPSVAGLAVALGVHRDTLYTWKDKAQFSDILGEILATQEKVLINKGLTGEFNPTISKLVLGKHGYHDRQDTQLSGKDGKPIEIKAITSDMDPKEASRLYKERLNPDA